MIKLFLLLILGAFVGCTTDITDIKDAPATDGSSKVFTATLAPADTKTYVDEAMHLYWTKGDMLTIFASTLNEKYAFDGNTGDNSATFSKVNTGFGYGNALERNYAVYPYSSLAKISNEGVLSISLPAKQNYAEQSFGVNANTMVAATENLDDCFLSLKSVGGFLKLRLYGEGVTVKCIRLEGNNSEKIAGAATVVAEYGVEPEVTMAADATGIITLNCGEGVALGNANEVKDFWIVVPPTVFEGGFTVTVVDTNNMAFKQVSEKKQEIVRNTVLAMPPVEVVPTEPDTYEEEEATPAVQPNNEIWYTSSDESFIVPEVSIGAFGANITDLIYENGKGIIRFDGDITNIGEMAFESEESLVSISLPESVTMIGIEAFDDCSALESVTLPSHLTAIGLGAFYNCPALKSITIPDSVTYLGNYCFDGCGFEEIVIPNGVKVLNDAFYRCANLTKVTLPEGILSLDGTFSYCSSLAEITIPNSVVSIGYGTFRGTAINEIICPAKVSYIAESAFAYCPNLTAVVIPEHIKTIKEYAFLGCENITSITIPTSVNKIGLGAFAECSSLKEITIPDGTTMEYVKVHDYGGGDIWEEKVLPFEGCSSLEKVSLGSGITEVCERMFYGLSNLAEVTLGANVETIGSNAFVSCGSLKKVTCLATVPPTVSGTMFSSSYIPYIYVPAESVAQYKAANGWSTYADYILAEGEEPGTGDSAGETAGNVTTLEEIFNNYSSSSTLPSDTCTVNGLTVVANNSKGIVATEEGFNVYIYNPTIIPEIGSVINVSGTVKIYNSILQFNTGAIITETGAVNAVDNSMVQFEFNTDISLDLYGEVLSGGGWESPVLASYTGTLTQNGNYYNVTVDGASVVLGTITSPTDEMKEILDALVGSHVKVTGYLLGVGTSGGTQYVQTMALNVEDLNLPDER